MPADQSCVQHGVPPICLLHPISVRTESVREECYYIWYWMANSTQHMVIF
jgi:hypothetical protein